MGAESIGQFAQQVEHGPGGDHDQQLRQKGLLGTEKLRQEGSEKQDVFRVAGAQHKGPAKQRTKTRGGGHVRHVGTE